MERRESVTPPRALFLTAGENLCYVGIVDILMRYGALKAAEHYALRWLLGDISCKPPREYAARFVAFARHVLHAAPDHGYLAPPHHGPFEVINSKPLTTACRI